jgi:hypothetical protein
MTELAEICHAEHSCPVPNNNRPDSGKLLTDEFSNGSTGLDPY